MPSHIGPVMWFSRFLKQTDTPGRPRNAYLSFAAHLPGGDLWNSTTGYRVCGDEDIHQTETQLALELG